MRRPRGAAVQRDAPAEDRGRSISRIVVLEGPDAGEDGAERAEALSRTSWIFVVASAHRQAETMAGRDHDARRPDLDVELVHLTGRERLLLVVRVVGPIGQCKL